ncbi:MAG: hypothetical protein FWG80_04540 [Alphaproteobacteria bacterium]|nr:hypothetical protein [Alphaproteobacteria bacterium]
MTRIKKFWIIFFSLLPFSAVAIGKFAFIFVSSLIATAGFSVYRSLAPVDMGDALKFFSSCWSCQLFGEIFGSLSGMLPKIFSSVGHVMIPMCIVLTAVWMSWTILASWIGIKGAEPDLKKPGASWSLASKFIVHLVKLTLVITLLAMPVPRLITNIFIEPVFNVGLSISTATASLTTKENEHSFEACLIATAALDPASRDIRAANEGAFSPKLRHNLTCQLAGIHQMTGLGLTVGWTILNMAFNSDYMHKMPFLWDIPIFPNTILILAGGLIMFLFLMALLPIPMYFLQVIIRLSMNLIMLPLMMLGWLFEGWKIMPEGGRNIKEAVEDAIRDTAGIAIIGVFLVFSVMFLNAVFGNWDGSEALRVALDNNDSTILMDALMMKSEDDSLVIILLSGIFIAFFMTSIPKLVDALFAGFKIPDGAAKKITADASYVYGKAQKLFPWLPDIKKPNVSGSSGGGGGSDGSGGGGHSGGSGSVTDMLPCAAVIVFDNADRIANLEGLASRTKVITINNQDDIKAGNDSVKSSGTASRILYDISSSNDNDIVEKLKWIDHAAGGKLKGVFMLVGDRFTLDHAFINRLRRRTLHFVVVSDTATRLAIDAKLIIYNPNKVYEVKPGLKDDTISNSGDAADLKSAVDGI